MVNLLGFLTRFLSDSNCNKFSCFRIEKSLTFAAAKALAAQGGFLNPPCPLKRGTRDATLERSPEG